MPSLSGVILTLGLGGIAGFCVGYFVKKAAKAAALLAGLLFILIQIMAAKGWLQINWGAANESFQQFAHSGAADTAMSKFLSVMVSNLPSAAGFIGGFYIGVKKG